MVRAAQKGPLQICFGQQAYLWFSLEKTKKRLSLALVRARRRWYALVFLALASCTRSTIDTLAELVCEALLGFCSGCGRMGSNRQRRY